MTAFYRKKPSRWTGETGRALRGDLLAQCVADYLMCPVAGTAYGLYPLDPDDVARAIGVPAGDVEGALQSLERLRFADYDPARRYVWVREMAAHQFDLPVPVRSYLTRNAQKWYQREPKTNPFLGSWFDRYAAEFRLAEAEYATVRRPDIERSSGVVVAITKKPLALAAPAGTTMALFKNDEPDAVQMPVKIAPGKAHPIRDVLGHYIAAFEQCHGSKPHIDRGKDARLIDCLLKQHGEAQVRATIDQMFASSDKFIVESGHTIGVLKACFNKLMIERQGGTRASSKTSKTAGAVQRFTERE